MASNLIDYVSEPLTEAERLANYEALCRGMAAGFQAVLARIRSYHELLELELDECPGAEVYLADCNDAVARGTGMLEMFAALGEGAAAAEPIDLRVLLSGVAARLQKIGPDAVSCDLGPDEPAFTRGRLFLLQQLLLELPGALQPQAGDPNAPLAIHARPRDVDKEFAAKTRSRLRPGSYLAVWVSRGAPEPRATAWTPLADEVTRKGTGTVPPPLLYCCGVVRGHGGDALVPRDQASVSGVLLLLPVQRNRVAMYSDQDAGEEALHGTETVLLVDDEGIIWDVVIDMLQSMGYTVILAADGRDCVEVYRENPGQIDLVLLDMVMPVMNGREAFHALKAIDPEVKVLLSSGYVREEDAQDVLQAGALGFLQKPYRMVDLARRIRTLFDGQHPVG